MLHYLSGPSASRRRTEGGLLLTCALCGRKQSTGLLSQTAWAARRRRGRAARACPLCQALRPDWETRLAALLARGEGTQLAAGPAGRPPLRLIPGGGQGGGLPSPRPRLRLVGTG